MSLVKRNLDGDRMETHGLGGTPTEFMTLPALSLLGNNDRATGIHILLHLVEMGIQVVENLILNGPLKEVELPDSRIHSQKLDALPPTEGIKHLFGIRLKMGLVGKVDDHVAASFCHKIHIVLLCIVGHEPVHEAKTNARLSGQNGLDTSPNVLIGIEGRQTMQNELLFALDLHVYGAVAH